MADQVVHTFDEEHYAVAVERQKMYPEHRRCPPPHYDWARGSVCGCGTVLLGSNPPLGGKGEQMEMEIDGEKMYADRFVEKFVHELDESGNCQVSWCPSTSDNGKDHMRYVTAHGITRTVPMNHDHLLKPGFAQFPPGAEPYPVPDTDAEHELAAGVYGDAAVDESKQLVLALPISRLEITTANGYIFGDEFRGSKLVEWAMLFIQKQADYGDGADDLGLEGQYAELHRKILKLRRAMWEGVELKNEPLNEVLMDLVGHCFLAMMYNDNPGIVRYRKGGKK